MEKKERARLKTVKFHARTGMIESNRVSAEQAQRDSVLLWGRVSPSSSVLPWRAARARSSAVDFLRHSSPQQRAGWEQSSWGSCEGADERLWFGSGASSRWQGSRARPSTALGRALMAGS